MLILRVITAVILIPLVLVGVTCLSQLQFIGILSFLTLVAAWEWSRLSGWIELKKRVLFTVIQATFLLILHGFPIHASLHGSIQKGLLLIGLVVWFLLLLYLLWARKKLVLPVLSSPVRLTLGWLILTVCWNALQQLEMLDSYLILFLFLIVWLTDVGAYVGGRLYGKHLLAPTLSPKKTWEGLIVGSLTAFLVMLLALYFFRTAGTLDSPIVFVLLGCTILSAVVGDLFESQLKRLEGVKDSGCLLPGHGGMLYRVDSLLAAAPVYA